MNPLSLLNGLPQLSGNIVNNTKKCEPVIISSDKKNKILNEYCRIISQNKEYIGKKFQDSFEKYSLQQFDNFNSKDFMDFIKNNIFAIYYFEDNGKCIQTIA
jgi:predicted metal-binding protein